MQQQFFPASDRPELLVDFTLPQNASIADTKAQMDRFEKTLVGDPDIDALELLCRPGAVRFYLPLDPQLANPFFGQVVIVTKSFEARERVGRGSRSCCDEDFAGIDGFVQSAGRWGRRSAGRSSTGSAAPTSRRCGTGAATRRRSSASNPRVGDIVFDWNEPGQVLRSTWTRTRRASSA